MNKTKYTILIIITLILIGLFAFLAMKKDSVLLAPLEKQSGSNNNFFPKFSIDKTTDVNQNNISDDTTSKTTITTKKVEMVSETEEVNYNSETEQQVIGREGITLKKSKVSEDLFDTKISLQNNKGEDVQVDTLDMAGDDAHIADAFDYTINNIKYKIILYYWEQNHPALGISGNLYEVNAYNLQTMKKDVDLSNFFESGFDGMSEDGEEVYKYKTKRAIIQKLKSYNPEKK